MIKKIIFVVVAVFFCVAVCPISALSSSVFIAKPINNIQYSEFNSDASVVTSYLFEENEELVRVNYDDGTLLVEKNDMDGVLTEQFTVSIVAPAKVADERFLFGGFFAGKNENFVVMGQTNYAESDVTEVLAVTKYSKDWKILSTCRIKSINTVIPFRAGSLRMDETGEFLYIHTCHLMYTSQDGLNHQANMSFKLRKGDMTVNSSFTSVMNIGCGYVSHSFNQFVKTDGDYVYRADHGDGYPRSMVLTKAPATNDSNGSVANIKGIASPIVFNGEIGDNTTGASLGGLEISSKNCIIVGNAADLWTQDPKKIYIQTQRNIFVGIVDKETFESKSLIYLTDYEYSTDRNSVVVMGTPQIVKCGEDRFAVMWNEWKTGTYANYKYYCTFLRGAALCYVIIDGDGNVVSPVRRNVHCALSDCQPIFTSDSKITWFYSDGKSIQYFKIDPYKDTILPHVPDNAVEENRIDATCSKTGSCDSVVFCKICFEELSRTKKIIGKRSHAPYIYAKENIVDATCGRTGSYDDVLYCMDCGEEISRKTETIEKLPHTPYGYATENIVEAVYGRAGSYDEVIYCTSCGEEISRVTKIIDPIAGDTGDEEFKDIENRSFLLGDIDGDGAVTVGEARCALRFAVGLDVPTATEIKKTDYNESGEVDVSDARMILRTAVNLEKSKYGIW